VGKGVRYSFGGVGGGESGGAGSTIGVHVFESVGEEDVDVAVAVEGNEAAVLVVEC
jgi:hypothetical protein